MLSSSHKEKIKSLMEGRGSAAGKKLLDYSGDGVPFDFSDTDKIQTHTHTPRIDTYT